MMARRLHVHVLSAWMGLVLAALGLLVLVVSFFLLPLFVASCLDYCAPPRRQFTAWAFSLSTLSLLPSFPVADSCILVLCYLPLLAAVMVVACHIGFLVRSHRAFATWGHRAWLTGNIALTLLLLVVLFVISLFGPEVGFLGLMFGYGLLWAGNHIVLNSVSAA